MNESCTVLETAAVPARPDLAADMQTGATSVSQQPQESGRLSSAEIAQKVMKLTGNVRLAARSAHHWHHCGINE